MKTTLATVLTVLFLVLLAVSGIAQKRDQGLRTESDVKAFTAIIATDEFAVAQNNRDLEAMRRLLKGTKLTVQPADPQLIPNCVPPYGSMVWGWQWVVGPNGSYWVYGEYCGKGSISGQFPLPMTTERMKKLPDEQKAYFTAFGKASKSKEFTEAIKTGNAALAKKLLVEAGAPSTIVLEVIHPKSAGSDPLPAETLNGGCSQWKLFTWWAAYPSPGHYYTTWQCVRWVVNDVVMYDSTQ